MVGLIRHGLVKLDRAPVDLECCHEKHEGDRTIPFGTYCYLNEETQQAICTDCGAKESWSTKERVKKIIGVQEIVADIKAMKHEKKMLQDTVMLLKKQVNIYRMGEQDKEIDKQRKDILQLIADYLRTGAGTKQEKEMFEKMVKFVEESKARQDEMREEISNYLHYLIIPEENRLKKKKKGLPQGEQGEGEEEPIPAE